MAPERRAPRLFQRPPSLRPRGLISLAVAAGILRRVAAAPAAGAEERAELPNGLVVVAEERRTAETVAVRLSARAGARDDGEVPGISVMTSRVMFQGTTRRPSETQLQRVAAQVGGTLGRGTGAELSAFFSAMPA